MLTTLPTCDLASVLGGCKKGECQQQQQQTINNYIPVPQPAPQVVQQAVPVPVPVPQRRSSVAVDVEQTA